MGILPVKTKLPGGGSLPPYALVKAWQTDGINKYISVPDDATLDITDNFSLELITNLSAQPAAHWQLANKRGGGADRVWDIYMLFSDSKPTFNVFETAGGSNKMYVYETPLDDGQDHQVGMTFAAGVFKIYIDGAEVVVPAITKVTDDAFTTMYTNAAPVRIAAGESAVFPTAGKWGRFVLWKNSVLSEAEYAELWNSATPTDPRTNHGDYTSKNNLAVCLLMEVPDVTGLDGVIDSSINNNPGTTQNMVNGDLVDF